MSVLANAPALALQLLEQAERLGRGEALHARHVSGQRDEVWARWRSSFAAGSSLVPCCEVHPAKALRTPPSMASPPRARACETNSASRSRPAGGSAEDGALALHADTSSGVAPALAPRQPAGGRPGAIAPPLPFELFRNAWLPGLHAAEAQGFSRNSSSRSVSVGLAKCQEKPVRATRANVSGLESEL